MKQITIRGARENNLRSIDLDLPRGQMVVITGLSGSGKSSLAFDTLYAEGQRRYVESLSAYARQFLDRMGRPDVDLIEGLSPAISIDQRGLSRNPRSTVATVTEIYDYLRLLFARLGEPHCYRCGKRLEQQTVQQIVETLIKLPHRTRLAIVAPVVKQKKGAFKKLLDGFRQDGFTRIAVDGELFDLGQPIDLDPEVKHNIDVYVDRIAVKPESAARIAESIELAFGLAGGVVKVMTPDGEEDPDMLFSEHLGCDDCGIQYPDLSPRMFSFNSPEGACPRCLGLGALIEFDEDRVVPNQQLSLREGAIEPWQQRNASYYQQILERVCATFDISMVKAYAELSAEQRRLLMEGSGEREVEFHFTRGGERHTYGRKFEGVLANLKRRVDEARKKAAEGAEDDGDLTGGLQHYMARRTCPTCKGARLRQESLHVLVQGKPITEVVRCNIDQAIAFFDVFKPASAGQQEIADKLLQEIRGRLDVMSGLGLNYLTLDRSASTLSGGEGQRVRLATQIGSALVGVMYILDEPSIGLHQRDTHRLLSMLTTLRDIGNTVILVEHDESVIRAADHIVDMGPGAGVEGGDVVAQGTAEQVATAPRSITGRFLSGRRRIELPRRRKPAKRQLSLRGVEHNNLQNVDAHFPLGRLIGVTGVSGSGKSSLVVDTLLPALQNRLHGARKQGGRFRKISGLGPIEKVVAIDQAPIGRSPRSNPATYTGVFSRIRELFAELPESRTRGHKAGRFSFNVKGGRCEACKGDGLLRIEMHFLPDVYVTCEVCQGKRYNSETLKIRYRGKSIADVLEMTVTEALSFFERVPKIADKLQMLNQVGLGYLALGQAANTLSGGEAQRIKLSRELARRQSGSTFYILDEPTTGLHFADVDVLLRVLQRLVDARNTVVVIEHNLDVIKCVDHVIDLGPEGGSGGGQIVALGTPEEVSTDASSLTGQYLAPILASHRRSR